MRPSRKALSALVLACALPFAVAGAEPGACPTPAKGAEAMFALPDSVARDAKVFRLATGLGLPQAREDWEEEQERLWRREAAALGAPIPESHYYFGCKFGHALEVLAERKRLLGHGHPYLRAWLRNQHAVFDACHSWNREEAKPIRVPDGLPPDLARLATADAAYQRAAQAYYRHAPEAAAAFAAIAADKTSPHRAAATYMLALIRFREDGVSPLPAVQAILGDPSLAPVHRITRQLLDILAHHTRDPRLLDRQIGEIGALLSRPAHEIDADPGLKVAYATALRDLDWFVADGPRGAAFARAAEAHPLLFWLRARAAARPNDDIRAWLEPRNLGTDKVLARALERKELPWAVAAMGLAPPDHPAVPGLLATFEARHRKVMACQLSEAEAVLHPDLLFHGIRLLLGRGEAERAVLLLEETARRDPKQPLREVAHRARQWLIAEGKLDLARRVPGTPDVAPRQILARDLKEFLTAETDVDLSPSTRAVLNRLPVARLAEAARYPDLSSKGKAEIARLAWTRTYLLEGTEAARKLSPILVRHEPDLAERLSKIDEGWTQRHRDNRAILFLLRTPRMLARLPVDEWSPWGEPSRLRAEALDPYNPNDNNWWCPLDRERDRAAVVRALYNRPVGLPEGNARLAAIRDRTLADHPVLKLADEAELARLAKIPDAPRYLAEKTLAWAKGANRWSDLLGQDKGLPEALALAVRATRYGCRTDGGHGAHSRTAFKELHRRFPESEQAEQTPYWFDLPAR
jgi:hypothetical protein